MEKIYDSSALSLFPLSDGMVFAYCQERDSNQITVAFKTVSFETGVMTNVTSDFFSIAKFGAKYKSYLFQIDNPITCKVAELGNGNIFISDDKSEAKILDRNISTVWSGNLSHKGNPVSGVAVDGSSLWCSYKDSGILVRYNTRTMRDELRLGGGKTAVISSPKGIYIQDGMMRVCDCRENKIFEIDLNTYAMNIYREFDEPVHQYIKVRSYELVLLDSGIYLL